MHAYAKLGVMPKRLAPACAHELKRRLPCSSFNQQDLANLLWSLCIFGVRPPAFWLASALSLAGIGEATRAQLRAAEVQSLVKNDILNVWLVCIVCVEVLGVRTSV